MGNFTVPVTAVVVTFSPAAFTIYWDLCITGDSGVYPKVIFNYGDKGSLHCFSWQYSMADKHEVEPLN